MGWTEPSTQEEINYFNKHAPERKLFGWFMWAILAIWAIADFYGFQTLFLQSLPPALSWARLPLTLGILIVLHLSIYTTTTTYFNDKFDSDDRTDSTIWIPVVITILMLFASKEGSKAILEGMVPEVVVVGTKDQEAQKASGLEAEKKMLDADMAALDLLYADRVAAAEKPYRDQITRNKKSLASLKWNEKPKRATLLASIKAAEEKRDKAAAALQAEKSDKKAARQQQYEIATTEIQKHYGKSVSRIEEENERSIKENATGLVAARRYSWVISVLLAALFWATAYRWTIINIRSGIVPQYAFTEMDKSGGPATWMVAAIADAYKRQMFRFSVWLHGILSRGARQLPKMDGRIEFVDPSGAPTPAPTPPEDGGEKDRIRRMYPRHESPSSIATSEGSVATTSGSVVITTHTDQKAELSRLLQRIQTYHSKWKNPQGGANQTIINNLIADWKAANEIMATAPESVLGEQVERYQRIVEIDFELFSKPRPRDAQKEDAA